MIDGVEDVTTTGQLAELLRALRRRHARSQQDRELTVREIAAKSGYAVGRVSEYLSGTTLPPTDRFDVLVGIFGATKQEQAALATARDRVEEAKRSPRPAEAPMQLPPDMPGFVGRENVLGQMNGPIIVITGPPGIGKSALAVRWAHRVAGRFPDGVLHNATPHAVMQAFKTSDVRTTLARRRVLLVLDDVQNADEVLPLLPGGGQSVVVVTSRDPLDALLRYGAQRFVLDPLPPDDTVRLLKNLINSPDELLHAFRTRWRHGATTEDSVEVLEAVLVAGGPDVRVLTHLGAALNHAGRYDEALQALEQARDRYADVEDHAGRGEVMACLGVTYSGLGRHDEAVAIAYKALALHRSINAGGTAEAAPFLQEARDVLDRHNQNY
ncbi:tetratricopeptide repeat protein [Lentzea sp. NPDC058450]|uniref:tetratricopeptide repeat protein n=1 Tax=Lentzea sp. NPDC058450 TaxID=3346505 RepID=UPI0036597ECB